MVLGDPVSDLAGTPGALALGNLGAGSFEHGGSDIRGITAARLVGEGIKAISDEGFEPEADGLLMGAKMAGNLGHTPASIGEADHFEAVASSRWKPSRTSALLEFLALVVC